MKGPFFMNHLDQLEAQSVFIIREAFRHFKNLAMLWSIGKDSNVMLHLVRKAFVGHVPFPLVYIDTTYDMPELLRFRDELVKKWNLDLVIGCNDEAIADGMNHTRGRLTCCGALRTEGLKQTLAKHNFEAVFAGIRRDEDPTRAKERVFSPRGQNAEWNVKDQPPEFWDQYKTDLPPGTHVRIHPLLHWTEIDIWHYTKRENIPIVNLYFAKDGKRYRSLGCVPCTFPIDSQADTLDKVIAELEASKTSERAGRATDQEAEDAFEQLRLSGHM